MRGLVAMLLALVVREGMAFDWKPCGGAIKVQKVDLQPDPPSPGSSVVFSVDGDAPSALDAGSTETDVYFMGFPIWAETGDLCDATECPVAEGAVTFAFKRDFPPITPPGNYSVQIHIKPRDGASEFMCVEVDFQVVPAGAASAGRGEEGGLQQ